MHRFDWQVQKKRNAAIIYGSLHMSDNQSANIGTHINNDSHSKKEMSMFSMVQ